MTTLTVTSKGQVTFNKTLLEHLGAEPGDRLQVTRLADGKLKVEAAPSRSIAGFLGILSGRTRKVATLDEIDHAARAGWTGATR